LFDIVDYPLNFALGHSNLRYTSFIQKAFSIEAHISTDLLAISMGQDYLYSNNSVEQRDYLYSKLGMRKLKRVFRSHNRVILPLFCHLTMTT
jgi:hypothetical protein